MLNLEWESQFVHNFRPELTQNIPAGVAGDVDGNASRRRANSTIIAGMIRVAQRYGRDGSQPLGIVERGVAGISMRNEHVRQRVAKPLAACPITPAVIAGVLLEDDGKNERVEEVAG